MSWDLLIDDIKNLLDDISGVADVRAGSRTRFTGYPAITITPDTMGSQRLSVGENQRNYVYTVRVFYSTGSIGIDSAIERAEPIVTLVNNKIDDEEKLEQSRTIGASLTSRYTVLGIDSVQGEWQYSSSLNAVYKDIVVSINVVYDFTGEEAPSTIEVGTPIGMLTGITYATEISL